VRNELKSSPGDANPPSPLGLPNQYRLNWRDILEALNLNNNDVNRRLVRDLNEKYDGPIILPRKGGQPRANKAKLHKWWNHLEIKFMTEKGVNSTKTTVESQHRYGRDEIVVPDISGHVRKRKGKKSGQ